MPTFTFPISRIEGHAQVVIEVQGGKVISCGFRATEFRGFSYFVEGTPAEQMPVIVPRICGVCSTAHHVCSVKTLEDAYSVTPPPLARTIRELLLLGQLIQNQATSLFIFTMPDRLGVESIFQVEEAEKKAQEASGIALKSLQVRKAGTDLITLAGGQFIHPVKAVIGGITSGIPDDAREAAFQKFPLPCQSPANSLIIIGIFPSRWVNVWVPGATISPPITSLPPEAINPNLTAVTFASWDLMASSVTLLPHTISARS